MNQKKTLKSLGKRKKFSDLELSALDTVFLSSGGAPDKGIIKRTADALKIDEQTVSCCRLPFGLLARTWLFASKYHPALSFHSHAALSATLLSHCLDNAEKFHTMYM